MLGDTTTEEVLANYKDGEPATEADLDAIAITDAKVDAIADLQLEDSRHDRPLTPRLVRNLSRPQINWGKRLADPEVVRWCYRIILGRQASAGEIAGYVKAKLSVDELRTVMLQSAEFLAKNKQQ